MVNIVRTHLIIILLYTHITITTTGTSDSVARRGGGGRKKCVSRVRVCAADQPVFSGERECVCANDACGGGGTRERERVRAPGEFVRAGESARECVRMRRVRRRRRHIIKRARAARRKRVAFIRAHPVAGVTTTAHCTRTSLAHTNTRHAHRQSARSRRHDRYTRVRPPPRTSYDSLFLSFTTFVVVVVAVC